MRSGVVGFRAGSDHVGYEAHVTTFQYISPPINTQLTHMCLRRKNMYRNLYEIPGNNLNPLPPPSPPRARTPNLGPIQFLGCALPQ